MGFGTTVDNEAIKQTRDAAQKLVESSLRIEKLTRRLNWLTIALIIETIALIGVTLRL